LKLKWRQSSPDRKIGLEKEEEAAVNKNGKRRGREQSAQKQLMLPFRGHPYVAFLNRWFDDMWSRIPDRYLIYSPRGFDRVSYDQIKHELEVLAALPEASER
jgi:hypothetical protein